MRLKGVIAHLLVRKTYRHLIYLTALFAPTLIKGSYAENDNLRGKEPCSLCSGGGKLGYPDATIPFFLFPGTESFRCSDLNFEASKVPIDSELCAKYQANAGYCGCPNAKPLNHCTFCPNGDIPSRPGLILPTGDICRNLHTYVSFLGEEQCTSLQYKAIANNAYNCGCEMSLSEVLKVFKTRQKPDNCTLCSDSSSTPNENYFLELAGMTCGDYEAFINGLDPEQCEIQTSRGTFDLFAYQCNCPGTAPPVCPIQENPELCTVSLLNSVDHDEPCECYSFCGGEFVGCENYPGNFLGDSCPQNGVSGCNYANAIDDGNGNDDYVEDPKTCSLCPDSTNDIVNPDAILPPFSGLNIPGSNGRSTCRDLVDYLSVKKTDHSDCLVAKARLGHYCGCDEVEPNCTLCPGGIKPSFKNKIATGDTTCEDFADTILTWEFGTCEIGKSYKAVMAARCGCISTEWPVCPVQQNPWLCTINLLRSTKEDCECYNFCGDKFHSCADYPGESLGASECLGGDIRIVGCNQALAKSQRCSRASIGPGCDEVDVRKMTHLRH